MNAPGRRGREASSPSSLSLCPRDPSTSRNRTNRHHLTPLPFLPPSSHLDSSSITSRAHPLSSLLVSPSSLSDPALYLAYLTQGPGSFLCLGSLTISSKGQRDPSVCDCDSPQIPNHVPRPRPRQRLSQLNRLDSSTSLRSSTSTSASRIRSLDHLVARSMQLGSTLVAN
jgi:hypothetical protein